MRLSLSVFRSCLVVLAAFAAAFGFAQDDLPLGAKALTLPVKLVDGHLIVSATLTSQDGTEDAISLELLLDSPATLSLQGDQYDWLKLEAKAAKAGSDATVRVAFAAGRALLFPAPEIKTEPASSRADEQNRLTRLFPSQLDERKVKGTLGLGFFQHYKVELNLAARKLVLTVPPAATAAAGETAPVEGAGFTGSFELKDGRMTLPVLAPGGAPARMILGSSAYDTLIDPAYAQQLGHPAGDVQPVKLSGAGGPELSALVPFRPKKWGAAAAAEADKAVLLSGVNLLEEFRLEIDWTAAQVRLTRLATPVAPVAADRAYFAAEAAGEADGFQAYLTANPQSRFGAEAATRLINLRLAEWGVSDEALLAALQWVADTSPVERRTENCLVYVNKFAALPDRSALTVQAAQLALRSARQAVTVADIYRLHRILGEQYLEQGDLPAAWTHLLSAAFVPLERNGRPDAEQSFRVALGLARVYERQGRFVRAYSRYKAALTVPGAPVTADLKKEITAAIERLRGKIPAEQLQMIDS